jgi:hypothetical protein
MKTIVSLAVAGALAVGSIAASLSSASAGQWNGNWGKHAPYPHGPYQYHQKHYQSGPDVDGALIAGTFLGLAFGALASQSYAEPVPPPEPVYLAPPHPNFAAVDQHIAWCSANYRSYNAERDTFIDFQNIERPCLDPYQQQN